MLFHFVLLVCVGVYIYVFFLDKIYRTHKSLSYLQASFKIQMAEEILLKA